jgi:hypothetical protein
MSSEAGSTNTGGPNSSNGRVPETDKRGERGDDENREATVGGSSSRSRSSRDQDSHHDRRVARRDDERREKKRHRKHRHDDSGSDSDSSDESDRHDRKHRSRKHDKKKKKKHRSHRREREEESGSIDSGSEQERDKDKDSRRKHGHKKHKSRRRDHSSDDDSNSDSDSHDNKRRKKHKKEKKKKKHKDRSSDDKDDPTTGTTIPVFGKYGIIKSNIDSMNKMQRSFDVWMGEVKGIPAFTGPKWELQNYFAEYAEDYNTATLPHMKYYDYEKWELEEYAKQQSRNQELAGRSVVMADELQHQELQKKKHAATKKAELNLVFGTMNREKVGDMKRQADLRSQMQIAYKTGDKKTYKRLKDKLEPEEK